MSEESRVVRYHGDALNIIPTLPDDFVDAVVTDPPYELGFMGRAWDASGIAYNVDLWKQCFRVLKPGGHLLAFGGTRTSHRLAVAIEDAGFEIRDSIVWIYGSGFPKSLDVSKAIDKASGAERVVTGLRPIHYADSPSGYTSTSAKGGIRPGGMFGESRGEIAEGRPVTAPATDDAKRWAGWGTALKPAHEPIVVARKPLVGTVAANVLVHGTGALNINACRVGRGDGDRTEYGRDNHLPHANTTASLGRFAEVTPYNPHDAGRWPANVVLDEGAAAELDEQSGIRPGFASQKFGAGNRSDDGAIYGAGLTEPPGYREGYNDSGGASRFFPVFRYQAKAPTRERVKIDGVSHPTVKPLELMRWLVRLVTQPDGVVLEPFAGSGTTVEACVLEGMRCLAIEREESYLPLIAARLERAGLVTW